MSEQSLPAMSLSPVLYDLHTHTTYSHGKGSIADNARAAAAAGLETLGIADHGPGHVGYGFRMSDLGSMRADIEAIRLELPGLRVLLGAEANIINRSGHLDISAEDQKLFDFIIAGYHYGVFGEHAVSAFFVHAGGIIGSVTGRTSRGARHRNTDLIIAAVENNDIKAISHPGAKNPVYIEEVAACCARRGTLLEINEKHGELSVESIRKAAESEALFILGSDAHSPERVGRVEAGLARAEEAGLELSRIVNLRG